jgi:hypothetical protein
MRSGDAGYCVVFHVAARRTGTTVFTLVDAVTSATFVLNC